MLKSALRWGCLLGAVLVVGPIVGRVIDLAPASDGSGAATGLVTASPVVGLGAMVAGLALAGAVGVVAARLVTPRVGVFCFGLALAWGCWSTGRVEDLLRTGSTDNPLPALGVEGGLLGLVAGAIVLVAMRVARREETADAEPLASRVSGTAIGGAAAAALIGAWAVARSDAVGQVLAAGIAAGLIGAAVARTLAPRAPFAALAGAIPVVALVGPILGGVLTGGDLHASVFAGRESGLARLMPLDWVAGMLMGLPLGATWAGSLVEKRHAEASPA